uniref:Uncharacterized protein n=1 Tax=Romanomermis culicivorax TaxID=13658 RepID=A0A915J0Y4_ROMCU
MKSDHCLLLTLFSLTTLSDLTCQSSDVITELATFRNRRSFKSRLENLFPTEYSGRCLTSPKSGRDICYPDLSKLDYSCVSKNQQGHRSVPPPRIIHGQYKALITKFRPNPAFAPDQASSIDQQNQHASFKPFLVVQYECYSGYEFLDEAEFLFCKNYNWHQTMPVCVPSNFVAEYRRKSNPCQENNGGCSHVCKHDGGSGVRCECLTGWELQDDQKTCLGKDMLVSVVVFKPKGSFILAVFGGTERMQSTERNGTEISKQKKEKVIMDINIVDIILLTIDNDKLISFLKDTGLIKNQRIYHADQCGYNMALLEFIFPSLQLLNSTLGFECWRYCVGSRKVALQYAFAHTLELDLCQSNNGGCSHFCEVLDSELVCSCPDGFMLRSDEKTCIVATFLLTLTGLPGTGKKLCDKFYKCRMCYTLAELPFPTLQGTSLISRKGTDERAEEIYEISDFLPEKSGMCPQVAFSFPDQKCASTCRRDQDCVGKTKCCSNGCANVCLEPEPGSDLIQRPILECTSTEGCRCVVIDESRQRCQCPLGVVCQCKSAPDVTISPSGVAEIRPGASLNLTCSASGFPHSNLTWFRDSLVMEAQEKSVGASGSSGSHHYEKTTTKRLLIKELFKSTVFSCEAVNDVGSSVADVEVVVTGPGSPPNNIQAKTTGTSVTIRWAPPTLPNGKMKGYQVYYIATEVRKPLRHWKTMGAVDPRITLDNLEPETRYFFRIMPYNERGSGVMTNVFSVKTEKKADHYENR